MAPPPPPPPPPPFCLPGFSNKKSMKQPAVYDEKSSLTRQRSMSYSASYTSLPMIPPPATPTTAKPRRSHTGPPPASSVSARTRITEDSDTYSVAPARALDRSNSQTRARKPSLFQRLPFGRKSTDRNQYLDLAAVADSPDPGYYPRDPLPPQSEFGGESSAVGGMAQRPGAGVLTRHVSTRSKASTQTRSSARSGGSGMSGATKTSALSSRPSSAGGGSGGGQGGGSGMERRPSTRSVDSGATLVGSAMRRKLEYEDPVRSFRDGAERLSKIRELMEKEKLDYYIVPSEDAHQSEYVAESDKRREWLSGFTGSAGVAIVSVSNAYLVTDSRYWSQARKELDRSLWNLIPAGAPDGPGDYIEWLTDRARSARIGVDARMVSLDKATQLQIALAKVGSKLAFPHQNFVDIARGSDRPARSTKPIQIHGIEYTGRDASKKLRDVRDWIAVQPPAVPQYASAKAKAAGPTSAQKHVGMMESGLSAIAYVLNLRGEDIPFNPVFHAYLYIGLDRTILFTDSAKLKRDVKEYLAGLSVTVREYNDVWAFLRLREWGDGKILISGTTTYAIALMLTNFRYTHAEPIIDAMKGVKNEVEIQGLKRAYTRDGACFVQFFAWLEEATAKGVQVSEWEAAWRLTEFRRRAKNYRGLAYENISATGPNAALPHYSPLKSDCLLIDTETPYLNDSGGQYLDGTCDTTRTVHLGRPSEEMCEAFTRVLQGHIAIDTAVFPAKTTGRQLDVLARHKLWQDGLNYLHGTGHGFGSYLNVHEGLHSFSNEVALVPGHVITNEPGYYKNGHFGIRLESALAVRAVRTKREHNGPIWLGFERLTCVPIQTKMCVEGLLSREEREWIKEHNRECVERLEPLLRDDKRALRWLKRQAERPLGVQPVGPGGVLIEWE